VIEHDEMFPLHLLMMDALSRAGGRSSVRPISQTVIGSERYSAGSFAVSVVPCRDRFVTAAASVALVPLGWHTPSGTGNGRHKPRGSLRPG
jgi:hypothetical protein